MNKPAHLRDRSHPESDIFEIRRPAPVIEFPMPYAAGASTCELLATMALDHAVAAERSMSGSVDHTLARRAAEDALLAIEALASSRRESDRRGAARAALTTGHAFLLLHEAHRAKAAFETAALVFDLASDRARAAEARVGLAKALLALHDPSARAVLEDAGELFEDLGDEAAVRAIDLALRQAEAEFQESPRSFHASTTRSS